MSKGINSYNKIIRVDSDKSISIRSFLIGSISHNITEVKNVLESFDVFSCIDCLRKLGVKIIKIKAKHYLIHGKGLGSFYAKPHWHSSEFTARTLYRPGCGAESHIPPALAANCDGLLHSVNRYAGSIATPQPACLHAGLMSVCRDRPSRALAPHAPPLAVRLRPRPDLDPCRSRPGPSLGRGWPAVSSLGPARSRSGQIGVAASAVTREGRKSRGRTRALAATTPRAVMQLLRGH